MVDWIDGSNSSRPTLHDTNVVVLSDGSNRPRPIVDKNVVVLSDGSNFNHSTADDRHCLLQKNFVSKFMTMKKKMVT